MAKRVQYDKETKPKLHRALTPEGRENQCIALAYDLVEERLRNGTASSQETTHFLKLATQKEMLEREKLEQENKLLIAKTEMLKAQEKSEKMYEEVLKAIKSYSSGDQNDELFDPPY